MMTRHSTSPYPLARPCKSGSWIGRLSRLVFGVAIAAGLGGCRGGVQRYYPIRVGQKTIYLVKNAHQSLVSTLTVTQRQAAAGVSGFELKGPSGTSLVAWKDGALYASELSGTFFDPPLPVLIRSELSPVQWSGYASRAGRPLPASATITAEQSTTTWLSQSTSALKVVIKMNWNGQSSELDSWYVPSVGLVEQEQWTNGVEDTALSIQGSDS